MGPDERQQWLLQCFDPDKPTEVVNTDDLVTFLRTFEEHTKLAGIDPALADAVIDAGYSTTTTISELTVGDLRDIVFKPGHARALAKYMGSRCVLGGVPPPGMKTPDMVSAATNATASAVALGTAMADAMDDRKAVAMLNSGKDERPPVRAVRTWIKEHLQRWRVSGSQLDSVLEKTLEDPEVDLDLFITAEPLHSIDKSTYRRVKASLTSDQFSGYGGAETESASRLIQNVFKAVINMPRKLFTAALGKLEALEESAKQSAVKTRCKTFEEKLYEVRFHATFEQSDAIEKLVGILKPHTFLMNQVMGEWASGAKDNVALSALLKSVKKRVDEKHEGLSQADNSPNTPSDGSSKKRGGGKPYQPSSAQSQSKSWRKPADLSSRPDNACNEFWRSGKCSFKSCRFQHVSNTPSVNQITSA